MYPSNNNNNHQFIIFRRNLLKLKALEKMSIDETKAKPRAYYSPR